MGISANDKYVILELAVMRFRGEISNDQEMTLESLLSSRKENKLFYDEILELWKLSSLYESAPFPIDSEASWSGIRDKINPVPGTRQDNPVKRQDIMYRIIKVAAVWILLISLGAFITWFTIKKQGIHNTNSISEVSVPLGSRSRVLLPDGTIVNLNAGSKLHYSQESFHNKREVYLEGEAYFNVVKMKDKYFVVRTTDINVRVYGTKFNIRSYPDENNIRTTLVSGSVAIEQVNSGNQNRIIYLKPNQTATFYKQGTEKPNTPLEKAVPKIVSNQADEENLVILPETNPVAVSSWKDSRWIITAKDFGQLAVELERRYNVNISFLEESLKEYKFSGTLEDETFEQVMKIIQLSAPVSFIYSIENNHVVLQYGTSLKNENFN